MNFPMWDNKSVYLFIYFYNYLYFDDCDIPLFEADKDTE
jgi:hypothetical protein